MSVSIGGSPGAAVLLVTKTASSSSALSFAPITGYKSYLFLLSDIITGTANTPLYMLVSIDGGGSYIQTAAQYAWGRWSFDVAGGSGFGFNASDSQFQCVDFGLAASNGVNGQYLCTNLGTSAVHYIIGDLSCTSNNGNPQRVINQCRTVTTSPVNGIRFLMGSGALIASGVIKMYGYS